MTVWFVAAVPVLLMFFALGMERLESRLRHLTVQENEVEEFLQAARPDEVRALFRSGIGRALELFRLRRIPDTGLPNGTGARKIRASHVSPRPPTALDSTPT